MLLGLLTVALGAVILRMADFKVCAVELLGGFSLLSEQETIKIDNINAQEKSRIDFKRGVFIIIELILI